MDNMREATRAFRNVIVAIDLGTAARATSDRIIDSYDSQTGALQYSAPEALGGLAGHRTIAKYTDLYALGCMLFELFNPDLFFNAFSLHNPLYPSLIHGMQSYIDSRAGEAAQAKQWRHALKDLGGGVAAINIDDTGSTVPPAITDLLNELLHRLTHVDYARRPTLEWARQRVDIAIRVLENQREFDRLNAMKKQRRKDRIEQQRLKDEKLRLRKNVVQKAVTHA